MASLSVVYPRNGGTTFDYDYYRNKHMPLVGQRWARAGLVGGEALLGTVAPDGSPSPYYAIGIIHFDSDKSLEAAMNGDHAAEIIGDIKNFTDVQPHLQINERFVPRA